MAARTDRKVAQNLKFSKTQKRKDYLRQRKQNAAKLRRYLRQGGVSGLLCTALRRTRATGWNTASNNNQLRFHLASNERPLRSPGVRNKFLPRKY